MSSSNEKPLKTDDEYDPSRLFEVNERGMTLNMDQFMKKPGVKEDIDALIDIGRAIRGKRMHTTQTDQGNDE